MLFTYFMHTKDEASQALKSFLADIAPYGRVKEVHSDNGTEYTIKFSNKSCMTVHQTNYHSSIFAIPEW